MTQNAPSRGPLLRMLVIGIGVFSLSFLLDPPHSPEHWSSDLLTAHFSKTAESQNQNLILVYISEATLEFADKPYLSPIDREVVANLVYAIDQAGAKVIGLDLILDRKTELVKDRKLIDTIKQTRAKIVLGVVDPPEGLEQLQFQSDTLGELGLTPKCKRVTAVSHITCGHIYFGDHRSNLVLSGYVVRFIEDTIADTPFLSFGNAVATAKSGKNYPAQSWTISWLLPPRDGSENFTTLDARSLLGAAPFARDLVNGKIVLIGGNFKDRDNHFTPLSITDGQPYPDFFSHFTRFFMTNGQRYPGLFIHAQFIAQILGDRHVTESSLAITILILFSIVWLAYQWGRRSGHYHLWLELGGIAALCLTTILLFIFGDFIFPLAYAAFAWIIAGAVGHYGNPVEKNVGPRWTLWIRMAIIPAMSLWAPAVMSADSGTMQDYQVVDSNLPGYEVGKMLDKLPDPAALPEGRYVRVLHQSRTILIEGQKKPDRDVGGTRDLPSKREEPRR
jgi:CHASE2 domain-containing sensor protein